jgi:RNA polymerase sigma-70 factor (ECF subfamily)
MDAVADDAPEAPETPGTPADGVETFVAAYRATLPAVFGYVMRASGGDRPLAEDVCADTYLDALAAWRDGRAPSLEASWFTGIARHKLIDVFRRAERESRKLALVHAAEPHESPDDFATVDRAELLSCARRLPPLQRAVLALRYGDDLSIVEIARRLDRDTAAIDSLLRRARAGLRRMLTEDEDE